jgi:hypothetical protein
MRGAKAGSRLDRTLEQFERELAETQRALAAALQRTEGIGDAHWEMRAKERTSPIANTTVTVSVGNKSAGVAQPGCEQGIEGAQLGLLGKTSRIELQERLLHALEERDEAKRRLGEALTEIGRLEKELEAKGMVNQRNDREGPLLLGSQAEGQAAWQSHPVQAQAAESYTSEDVETGKREQRSVEIKECGSAQDRSRDSRTESMEERASVKAPLDELCEGEQQIRALGSRVSKPRDGVESQSFAAKGAGAVTKGTQIEAIQAIEMETTARAESDSSLVREGQKLVSDLDHTRIESRSIEDAKWEDGAKDAHKLRQRVRIEGPENIESIGVAMKSKSEGTEVFNGHVPMVDQHCVSSQTENDPLNVDGRPNLGEKDKEGISAVNRVTASRKVGTRPNNILKLPKQAMLNLHQRNAEATLQFAAKEESAGTSSGDRLPANETAVPKRLKCILKHSQEAGTDLHRGGEGVIEQAAVWEESASESTLSASKMVAAGRPRSSLELPNQARASLHQKNEAAAAQAQAMEASAENKLPASTTAVAGGLKSILKLPKQVRATSHQGDKEAPDQAALRCQVATLVRKSLVRYLKEAGKREGGLKQGLPEGGMAAVLGVMRSDIESLKMAAEMSGAQNKVMTFKHTVTAAFPLEFLNCAHFGMKEVARRMKATHMRRRQGGHYPSLDECLEFLAPTRVVIGGG